MIRFLLGKMLELAGVLLLPAGLYYGMSGRADSEKVELALLGMGGAVFVVGWLLERSVRAE